jgi:hypothetical protein
LDASDVDISPATDGIKTRRKITPTQQALLKSANKNCFGSMESAYPTISGINIPPPVTKDIELKLRPVSLLNQKKAEIEEKKQPPNNTKNAGRANKGSKPFPKPVKPENSNAQPGEENDQIVENVTEKQAGELTQNLLVS